jgi:Flp pilus assembly protein TadD
MLRLPKISLLLLTTLSCATFSSMTAGAQTQQPSVTAQQSSAPVNDDKARGIALYQQGEAKAAVKALRDAVKQDKDDAEGWYYLGLALSIS